MAQAQNKLARYLEQAVLAYGAQRVQILQKIREYLQNTDCTQLNVELQQITNLNMLRMLQAAGVPQCLQTTFFVQFNKAARGVQP